MKKPSHTPISGFRLPKPYLRLLDLLLPHLAAARLAMHFHDTYGHAVENALAARERGVSTFDASAGGIGGCPYAPGASGNVATEALVEAFRAAGDEVPVDLAALGLARATIARALGRELASGGCT